MIDAAPEVVAKAAIVGKKEVVAAEDKNDVVDAAGLEKEEVPEPPAPADHMKTNMKAGANDVRILFMLFDEAAGLNLTAADNVFFVHPVRLFFFFVEVYGWYDSINIHLYCG